MGHKCKVSQEKKWRSAYINSFVTSKCAPDLLLNGLFPNGKEVTESWAMFEATRHLGPGFEWNNRNVICYVIGDGHVPRTAAMFAYRTAWMCVSVDPLLVPKKYDIDRLILHRCKIENIEPQTIQVLNTLIVLPHSHAKIKDCLRMITTISDNRAVISMDCCVNQIIPDHTPDVEYADENVWSPKNIVRIWRSV